MFCIQTVKESSWYSFSFICIVASNFSTDTGGEANVLVCVCGMRVAVTKGGRSFEIVFVERRRVT